MKALLILVAVFAALGCTKKSSTAVDGFDKSETLRLRVTGEPPSLDWQQADDIPSVFILENLMEGLLRYDFSTPGEPKVAPGLASEWRVSPDGKKYFFKLRPGTKWSDGVPFRAQHAVDAWKRTLTKETAAPYSRFLFHIKSARCYFEGKCAFEQVGIKATESEIHIELEAPVSYFPFLLAHFSSHPIRKDLIDANPKNWTDAGKLVSIGPFVLKTWEHDRLILLERNPHYYVKYPNSVKNVVLYMVEEWVTAQNLYKNEKIDFADAIPATEVRALESNPDFRRIPRMSTSLFGFNVEKSPTNNLHLRKAIAHAINREEILGLIQGGRKILNSIVPEGLSQPAESTLEFDPEKARAFFKRSGLRPPIKLDYRFASSEDNRRIAENIQAQLKKNLGIEVNLIGQEFKTYVKNQRTDPTPIFPMGWAADYPDPSVFFSLFTSDSINNTPRWKNPAYDALVAKGHAAQSPTKRAQYYGEAQKLLLEDGLAVFPTYTNVLQYLVHPRVEGLIVNPRGLIDFRDIKVKP